MKPTDTEPLCIISFEVARVRLGGGPDDRPSFWKAYREEKELNEKTDFRNFHVSICRHHIVALKTPPEGPVFFRRGRLVSERDQPLPQYEG